MKFFYSILIALSIWSSPLSLSGQIPNGDFEEWIQTPRWDHPVGWTDPWGNPPCTIKDSASISGQYSMQIKGGQTNKIGCTIETVFEVEDIYNLLQFSIRIDSIREDSFTSLEFTIFEKNDARFIEIGSHKMFHPTDGVEVIEIPIAHSGSDFIKIEIYGRLNVTWLDQVLGYIDAVLDDFQLSFVTSIHEGDNGTNSRYTIFPQPVSGSFYIRSEDRTIPQRVEIISSQGIKQATFQNTDEINIEAYPAGIYFIKILSNEGVFQTEKVIKVN